MDERSQHLYELGVADLASRFDSELNLVRNPFLPQYHSPHPSLWYAGSLLRTGDRRPAEQIIDAALALQQLDERDPHFGNFRWHYQDPGVFDLNACQFVLEAFLAMHLDVLSHEQRSRVCDAMKLAYAEAERLDVHWTYTNIFLLDLHNRILGGQIVGDERWVNQGEQRLREWASRTRDVGAPHEFNSPTYAAVDLICLANLAARAADERTRDLALEMEQFVWRHIAQYWHANTMQLGGPHSRAYRRDVTGAAGFLKVVLYKLLGDQRLLAKTPYYEGPDAEGHVIVAGTEFHCPPDARAMFHEPATRAVREVVAHSPETVATAVVTPAFTLGTMTRQYGVGGPPEPWPMNNSCIAYWKRGGEPGYGVLYTRYRINAGRTGVPSREKAPPWLDIWEDGVFRVVQEGGRAVAGYGLTPRGQRPMESLRLDIRLLGPGPVCVRFGENVWDGAPAEVNGQAVVIADGDLYIGIVPLVPTAMDVGSRSVLWRDGGETVLSIVNYEGPPKVFWEYRSLGGPFWKGNMRNGFALWIAPPGEFESPASFANALAGTPLKDEVEGTLRRVGFGDLRLEYDLCQMWP